MYVPLVRPSISKADFKSVIRPLMRRDNGAIWLSQGPIVKEFEHAVAEYLKVDDEQVVACSSGTAALHLALSAMHFTPGAIIGCPSLTFIATANAISMVGCQPYFLDVDEDCAMVDPQITHLTSILPVHQFGMVNEWRYYKSFVHDACPSFGAPNSAPIGSQKGDKVCFSLHALKVLTCGEGGIFVGPKDMAEEVRLLRCHGMTKSAYQRSEGIPLFESYVKLGYNYRMPELTAALALSQIGKIDRITNSRCTIAEVYDEEFQHYAVRLVGLPYRDEWSAQSYLIEAPRKETRDEIIIRLKQNGVESKRGCMACHREPVYRNAPRDDLPMTNRLTDRTFRIPLFEMCPEEIDHVVAVTKKVLGDTCPLG